MPKKHSGARGAYSAPNCGPTAVAFITGRTVPQIMREMKRVYNLPDQWRGSSFTGQLCVMLTRHGIRHAPYAKLRKRVSLGRWVESDALGYPRRRDHRYIIRTGGHFLALYFDDGWRIVDQSGNRTLASDHAFQRKMVTGMIIIL